jgi:hypothetical protein
MSEWLRVIEVLATAGAGGALLAYVRRTARRRAAKRRLDLAIAHGIIDALDGVLEDSSILHGNVTATELASRRALLHARLKRARDKVQRCIDDLR